MRVKVDIFSGFLGAGKTMLIKKLISENLKNESIAIIENEFGEVGIDGTILRKSNIEVKEINAGCICCTIAGDFKKAILEVINKFNPKRIIIEPSGVGKLSEILSVCKDKELKDKIEINMIITVVDVLKYDMYISNFAEFYSNQIINAKTVILSRTQKSSSNITEKVTTAIRQLNNKANIITTPWDKLNAERIIAAAEQNLKNSLEGEVNLLKKSTSNSSFKLKTRTNNHYANEVFETWGVETAKRFCKLSLENILNRLQDSKLYGTVLRAKGIIQTGEEEWMQFDYVPEEIQMKNTKPDYSGRLCIIGNNLNRNNIKNLFGFNEE
jgi:Putative GTPases (G3E family)